jgi:acetylornithine deacetylase/succinyl-diaminopimelate desuccinylase family protein
MDDLLKLLCDLISIPSVSPTEGPLDDRHGEARMVAYLADRLTPQGIDIEIQEVFPGRENLIAHLSGRSGPSLVFEAHTDTVEVHNMTHEPFVPVVREGQVWGRGACDCKASLAAMLIAFEEAARRGTPPGDLTLAATCDEEYRFAGVRHLLDHGFRAEAAVVGEPTNLELVVVHKGALRLRLLTHGVACHSSEPSKGDNAIYHMARVVSALEAYGKILATRPPHPLVQGPTLSVGLITGGQAPNIVPDRCEVTVDRRLVPGESVTSAQEELLGYLAERLVGVPWESQLILADPPMELATDSPFVERCGRAVDRVLGSHVVTGVQYGTDASKFAEAGMAAVVIGPGDIAQAHTATEWVAVEQVEQARRIYEEIIWGG